MKSQNRWTSQDLHRLPEEVIRYELWNGELLIGPAPTMRHHEIVRRLMKLFALLDPDDKLGRLYAASADVVFSDRWVYQPDLFFVAADRLDIIKSRHVSGAPDLCIDILAPSTTAWIAARRRRVYERFGVKEYWLVNPFDKMLALWSSGDDWKYELIGEYQEKQIAFSQLLDGLSVGISALFEGLPDEPPADEELF